MEGLDGFRDLGLVHEEGDVDLRAAVRDQADGDARLLERAEDLGGDADLLDEVPAERDVVLETERAEVGAEKVGAGRRSDPRRSVW